jgi:RNA polymerase sigma factor (sigma-70 family)
MELLERFARGELEAFEALFRQFQGEVYCWIARIVRDRSAAEELTVETFWRIYRSHARFDPARSFGAWARRIATNVALDHLKSTRREATLAVDPPQGPTEDPAVGRDVREKIASAFHQLPQRLQVVATLALIEERSYPEIAEALGISLGAVKSRVFRAVRQLQGKLKRLGIEP